MLLLLLYDDDTSQQGSAPHLCYRSLLLLCLQMGTCLKRDNYALHGTRLGGKTSTVRVRIEKLANFSDWWCCFRIMITLRKMKYHTYVIKAGFRACFQWMIVLLSLPYLDDVLLLKLSCAFTALYLRWSPCSFVGHAGSLYTVLASWVLFGNGDPNQRCASLYSSQTLDHWCFFNKFISSIP